MSEGRGSANHTIDQRLRDLVLPLAPGALLPPERQLAERWGVARMTVRRAIAELAREGVVRTVHGRGNLRAPEPISLRIRLGSFATTLREHHLEPSTKLLSNGIDPDPPQRVIAFLGTDTPALRIRRLRLGDGVPLAIEQTWLRADLMPEPDEDLLAGSLYDYLEEHDELPDAGEESVRADLPDAVEARLLEVAGSRPVLRLARWALLRGRPIEYAEAVFPADRCELWFPLGGPTARGS